MAITRVQGSTKQQTDNGVSLAFNFTGVTSGNTLFVLVSFFAGTGTLGVSAVSDGDGTYTRDIQLASGSIQAAIYRRESASAGTHAITIAPGGTGNYITASAVEVSGLASSCLDKTSSNSAIGSNPTSNATATTTVANEILMGVCAFNGNPASIAVESLSPAWVEEYEETNGALHIAGEGDSRIVSSTGAYTANWTGGGGSDYVAVIATYKGSSGGGGTATSDDHMSRADMNTAMKEYLNALYSTANQDVQPLIERYLKDYSQAGWTAAMKADVANRWQYLIKCAKGQETT